MNQKKLVAKLQELSQGNDEYRRFHERIVNDATVQYLGVRMPELRQLAKEIAKGDWRQFLIENTWRTHEEKMLACIVPQYIRPRLVLTELFSYFDEIAPHLSSWAMTDTLAMKYPQISADLAESYKKIVQYVLSDNPWVIRLGIILLMANFLVDEYIDGVLILVKNINSDEYYVKMAIAWLLAEVAVTYRDKAERAIEQVDDKTARYARQKMRDSRRIR
jgi:3-methyladenine DNA glycosylase AlkD